MAKHTTNSQVILTALILGVLLYLGKIFFWPTEKDTAKKQIATLAKIVSFPTELSAFQSQARLVSLKSHLTQDATADLTEFFETQGVQEQSEFDKKDLDTFGPIYFAQIQKIEILTTDFKEIGKRTYQVVVIAKGKAIAGPIDHAYLTELNFTDDWKLRKIKVLAPPQENLPPSYN